MQGYPSLSQAIRNGIAMVATSIVLLCGCAASTERPIEVLLQRDFPLQVGHSAYVAEAGLTVGFQGVSSDSRCAKGEVCVWEGDATVLIWIQKTGGSKDEFELHTGSRGQNVETYKGFSVRLVTVLPKPVTGVEIVPANYTAIFHVTAGTVVGDYIH
jgi:hypothetical protein